LSRLTGVATIAGRRRGGLGRRNQSGQSQDGDERFHLVASIRVADVSPAGECIQRGANSASACGTEDATGGAAVL
jgi:hypothetical protein